ncbi:ribonucleoside hydrolase RihC, partial [Staphylococcus condimenti]
YLLHPENFTVKEAEVNIELTGTYTKGETVVDFSSKTTNATVVLSVDKAKFKNMLFEALSYAK